MSGSRKSLRNNALNFNPRAQNSWSKDDSKFGQRMLEKMGWKKGEGIGLHGQGIAENIKLRWKFDNKGFGFHFKDDEWVGVKVDFSKLSHLNQTAEKKTSETPSLELTSVSSRSRVHYKKYIRSKDISRYSKQDLSGILGRKECDENDIKHSNNEVDVCHSENEKSDDYIDPVLSHHNDNDCIAKKKSKKKLNADTVDGVPQQTVASPLNDENFAPMNDKLDDNVVEDSAVNTENDEVRKRVQLSPMAEIVPKKKSKKAKYHLKENSDSMDYMKDDISEESLKTPADCQNIFDKKTRKKNKSLNSSLNIDEDEYASTLKSEDDFGSISRKKRKKIKLVPDEKTDIKDSEVICIDDDNCDQLKPQIVENSLPSAFVDERVKKKKKRKKPDVDLDDLNVSPILCDDPVVECKSAAKLKKKVADLLLQSGYKKNKLDDNTDADQTVHNNGKKKKKFDCEAPSSVEQVIKEFEDSKEKLLNQYRQNYIRRFLESANENDIQIYCDLDGHELDCKKNDEDISIQEDEFQEKQFQEKQFQGKPVEKFVGRVRPIRMTKAERIIEKARLLKKIQEKNFVHNFDGSNLNDVVGYGNEIIQS